MVNIVQYNKTLLSALLNKGYFISNIRQYIIVYNNINMVFL